MYQKRLTVIPSETQKSSVLILPGENFSFGFRIQPPESPREYFLRIVGEADLFWKWRQESGIPYYICNTIEDVLTTRDTPREKFAVEIHADGEDFPRNAFLKFFKSDFLPGKKYTFECAGKSRALALEPGGEAVAELGIYLAKEGRHENDTWDMPDRIEALSLKEGTHDWETFSATFVMPENAVALLLRIGVRKARGVAMFGSPRLIPEGGDNLIPPFDHTNARRPQYNYLGENLSRREWSEFTFLLDGKEFHRTKQFTTVCRKPYIEIPLPPGLSAGKHIVTVRLDAGYESAVGYRLFQADLLEEGARDFEILAFPEFQPADVPCPVLLKTTRPNVTVEGEGVSCSFENPDDHVMVLPPMKAGAKRAVALRSAEQEESFTILQVVEGADDGVRLSTGDAVYVPQAPFEFMRYLRWYAENRVGNAICFRPCYRWSGSRTMNPDAWKKIIPYLEKLNLDYTLMVDGRELPGKNANPPDSLLAGPHYRGRQAHENDGSFYYWGNRLWQPESMPEPYADVLSRSNDPGGIQPHVRPPRNGSLAWWFFDPTDQKDMKGAAEAFVRNLAAARGESTRHTGPSTLFRYFYQAGYRFLGAEQMYGPEDLVLSSLRGASRAYGRSGYGAHLAVQWSSTPHNTPEHARRYFLSLAACYLQGVTEINTEEGLWRMEKEYVDYDRYSENCLRHLEAHTRFRRFLQTHRRRGVMTVPVAVIQGRYEGACNFAPDQVWNREGEPWKFGPPEDSMNLLRVFFPRFQFKAIYSCPCPVEPQGWYSGTPYGPVDLVPVELPDSQLKQYRAAAFLGWHTFSPEDSARLLSFVENGGRLILARPHLSTNVERCRPSHLPESDASLDRLLGEGWRTKQGVLRRKVGRGTVVYFADDLYPADASIRAAYEKELADAAMDAVREERKHGWIRGSEDVDFTVYDREDGLRVMYLLNINWWKPAPAGAELLFGGASFKLMVPTDEIQCITLSQNTAVLPLNLWMDVISMTDDSVRVQSAEGGELVVFRRDGSSCMVAVESGVAELSLKETK